MSQTSKEGHHGMAQVAAPAAGTGTGTGGGDRRAGGLGAAVVGAGGERAVRHRGWNRENHAELARRGEIEALRRARALPYKATTATAAAGAGGWATAELAQLLAGPTGHLVASAATPAAAAVGLAAARLIHRERIGAWSVTFDRASAGAVTWLATTTATGPGWWQLLALGAGAVWVSAPWMRAHREPLQPPAADDPAPPELPPAPAAVTEDQGQRIAARWASEVIGAGGVIPRAQMLTDRVDLDRGYRWTIQLGRGDYYSKIAGLGEAVAAALARPANAVLLEPYPGDASRALLTVITRDALADGVAYGGPVYDDGQVPIGLFADGDGVARVVVTDSGGVYPVALTGDARTGKSVTFEAIAAALRNSGQWMVLGHQ